MERLIYPCTKNGKILKGFCPTVVTSDSEVARTLCGWILNSKMFGIKFWYDGNKVLKLV